MKAFIVWTVYQTILLTCNVIFDNKLWQIIANYFVKASQVKWLSDNFLIAKNHVEANLQNYNYERNNIKEVQIYVYAFIIER